MGNGLSASRFWHRMPILSHHRSRAAPARIGEKFNRTKGLGFVIVPVDKHGPANDQVARNKAPGSTIQTVVAIVAHHKVGIGGNLCRFAVDGEVEVWTAARLLSGARRVHSSLKIINVIRLVALAWRVLGDLQ